MAGGAAVRRCLPILLATLLATACGAPVGPAVTPHQSGTTPSTATASPTPSSETAPETTTGATTGTGPEAGGGSPLRIPLPVDQLRGRQYADGLADLQAAIAGACGTVVCVGVDKVGEETELAGGEVCDTIDRVEDSALDPETSLPFVAVQEGGTITIVVNVRCEDLDEEAGGGGTSPVRIPLPIDNHLGAVFGDRIDHLRSAIVEACGGDECVTVVRIGAAATLPGGEVCDTITSLPGTVWEDTEDEGFERAYLLAERGGTVTVVVNVRCEDLPVDDPPVDNDSETRGTP